MVSTIPPPSPRLVRAAAAERAELDRHRAKLLAMRESLRAQLAGVEEALGALGERALLLERLTAPAETAADAPVEDPRPLRPAETAPPALRGPAIRRAAVQVLLDHPEHPDALHYRDWFDAVRAAGYEVAGKDPLAVFLTQLGRSPVIRKGTQTGVYELDRAAPRRLRQRLDDLQQELRQLTAAPAPTVDLATIRTRRAQLTVAIGQVEKALEEAQAALSAKEGTVPSLAQ